MKKHGVKVKLKSYDKSLLKNCIKRIFTIAKSTDSSVVGPVPLPLHIKKFTILSSPHVDKKTRDQYEIRKYKRLIIIPDPKEKTLDLLMKIDFIAGIDVRISII